MLMNVVGCVIALVLLKKHLKLSDLIVSTMALASLLVDSLIKTFATNSWHLYLASAIALLKMLSGPMLRSVMSTIVPKSEISMIYSITSAIESISGLGASPLYTFVYSTTLISFPGAFNLITACMFAAALLLIYFVGRWLMNSKQPSSETIQTYL
jgi:PCFT/HCP family folate transporter-like MFS transporter 1/3